MDSISSIVQSYSNGYDSATPQGYPGDHIGEPPASPTDSVSFSDEVSGDLGGNSQASGSEGPGSDASEAGKD